MSEEQFVPFIGVSRHRMATDGNGVTTLAAFHGCRLGCRYCLNPQCRADDSPCLWHTPETLYEEVRADELYFLATGGGITFGGGEPLLYPDFIVRFRDFCGPQWKINVETSLNVAAANVEAIADVADAWFIDVKDLDACICRRYTGHDNAQVIDNLSLIAGGGRAGRCIVSFTVRKDGSIADVKVVKKLNDAFDSVAVDVVKGMPRRNPGKRNGKCIDARYTIPIIFGVYQDDVQPDKMQQ